MSHQVSSRDPVYPFLATGAQLARGEGNVAIKLPTSMGKVCEAPMVSLTQAMTILALKNDIGLSLCTGSPNTFHLDGPPGSGKTACISELIRTLVECDLVSTPGVLLCCKSNSALANLATTYREMTEMFTLDKSQLLDDDNIRTVNSGFSIPVIDAYMNIEESQTISALVDKLRKRIMGGLGRLELLVIDEYMMTSALEVVYIDAVLRIINHQSEIPFGGVIVIFLGDNRQNSSIPTAQPTAGVTCADNGGGRGVQLDSEARRMIRLLSTLIKETFHPSWWASPLGAVGLARTLLNNIPERKDRVAAKIDRMLQLAGATTTATASAATPPADGEPDDPLVKDNTDPHGDRSDGDDEDPFEFENWSEDTVNLVCRAVEMAEKGKEESRAPVEEFAERFRRVASLNGSATTEKRKRLTVADATFDVLVEEGLRVRVDRTRWVMSCSQADLVSRLRECVDRTLSFAADAFGEIVQTGREKLYILSELSDHSHTQTSAATIVLEILQLKLMSSRTVESDPCIDELVDLRVVPRVQDRRYDWLAECVRNAFLRSGQELKGVKPIAELFFDNLPLLMAELDKVDLNADELTRLAARVLSGAWPHRAQSGYAASEAIVPGEPRECNRDDDDDDDDDDEDDDDGEEHYDDPDEDCGSQIIIRPDAPIEIGGTFTILDRARVCTSNQAKWRDWLRNGEGGSCGAIITNDAKNRQRNRFWHLYYLARAIRLGYVMVLDDSAIRAPTASSSLLGLGPITPLFGRGPFPVAGGAKVESPYWLRALSMPVVNGPQRTDGEGLEHLPAYSSMLSIESRSFVLASLKRVRAAVHAYGLMYGLSLYNMTTDPSDHIDHRPLEHFLGKNRSESSQDVTSVNEYVSSIFPDLMNEFFSLTTDEIKLNEKMLNGSMGLGTGRIDKVASELKANDRALLTAKALICGAARSKLEACQDENRAAISRGEGEDSSIANPVQRAGISVADKINGVAHTNRHVKNIGGSIALMKSNASKNTVASIVEKVAFQTNESITCRKRHRADGGSVKIKGFNAIEHKTQLVVAHENVTCYSLSNPVPDDVRRRIVSAIYKKRNRMSYLIDKYTDANLLANQHSQRSFTRQLCLIRKRVTRTTSIMLYVQQNVIFTVTNSKPYIFHTPIPFYTSDTGVVTSIKYANDELVVDVAVNRLGDRTVSLKVGRAFLDRECSGGNYVDYLPLASQQTMTIYSSQGWTLRRNTVVDLWNASHQDTYVAVTRCGDPRHLRVLSLTRNELCKLKTLRCGMGRNRTYLFPLGGGIRGFGASSFVDNHGQRSLDDRLTRLASKDKRPNGELYYGHNGVERSLVPLAQKYVLDGSGNVMAFNSKWTEKTGSRLASLGGADPLATELENLQTDMFGHSDRVPADVREHLTNLGKNKMLDLFMAVHRSKLHYRLATATGSEAAPTLKALDEYAKTWEDRGYIKFDPAFVTERLSRNDLALLFYDIFPHSASARTFAVFAHYLFLVYEGIHLYGTAFAFVPGPREAMNINLRSSDHLQTSTDRRHLLFPGHGLSWESEGFAESRDGGQRKARVQLTQMDAMADEYLSRGNDTTAVERRHSMLHNLRRIGKYCRPSEVCGLNNHGAVVVASDCETLSESHVYAEPLNGRRWTSYSFEANLHSMLVYHLHMAAASKAISVQTTRLWPYSKPGATLRKLPLEPVENSSLPDDVEAVVSDELLLCGTCDPLRKAQLTLHFERSQGAMRKYSKARSGRKMSNARGRVFVIDFWSRLGPFKDARVVVATKIRGHAFAAASTSEVRTAIANESLGEILCVAHETGPDLAHKVESLICEWVEKKEYKRLCVFLSFGMSDHS
nr:MAG: wsv447-like protein [Marsupenaeus japonicus pemonivirus]